MSAATDTAPAAPPPSRPKRSRLRRWLRRCVIASAFVVAAAAIAFAVCWHAFPFPQERLDRWPTSPVVTDRLGGPMLELVAADEQWRFPVPLREISPWLIQATIAVEDQRFRRHCGVDALAVGRAIGQIAAAGRVVSGASTITMQICRMMDERPRSLWAKTVESFRALQLERLRSKDEILEIYLNAAPYGRNLRGVEAASLVYFGRHAKDLSLGQAALLAGLPQSPARYRPDRWAHAARARRGTVLRRMLEEGMITSEQMAQADAEPVVIVLRRRARAAQHAAWMALRRRPSGGRTTIDPLVQGELARLAAAHLDSLPAGTDLAAVIIGIESGEIVAMLGSPDFTDPLDGAVNGATAWRSPGSALKPFIYMCAFTNRRLRPDSVVYDVPIQRAGWAPTNFDGSFAGRLTAADALRRSLNIPAILVAEAMGLPRCAGLMASAGVAFRSDPELRGGLATVTGAVEVRLIDLTNAYATIGRGGVRRAVRLFAEETAARPEKALDTNACAAIDEILSSRARRPRGMEKLEPAQVPWFMWKTGTSSARRDAWSVGHNRRYAIGVWVGRFGGRGRAAYVGSQAAEPLLAELFALPAVRCDGDPPPPAPWVVAHELPPPAELRAPPKILSPSDSATFLAMDGSATIRPRANRADGLSWFLNGALLPSGRAGRLVLSAGRYELRCVDAEGNASAVRFAVR